MHSGVAQVSLRDCHCAALRRRSILCGTFRDTVVAATLRRRSNFVPWRYQARCPCHEFWPALARRPCFITVSGLSSRFGLVGGGFTPPLFSLSQRSPGSPATCIISRNLPCAFLLFYTPQRPTIRP